MMSAKQKNSVSKFLSLVLRHKPDEIGLILDKHGWANINELIEKANVSGQVVAPLSLQLVRDVVDSNEKRRFVISDDGLSIRANQGHSIDVDLQFEAKMPPLFLYHGTATRFMKSIEKEGLTSQKRQYVHLSSNIETATEVGRRYGKPVILKIEAQLMHEIGHVFYRSENGVWLTEYVPCEYFSKSA